MKNKIIIVLIVLAVILSGGLLLDKLLKKKTGAGILQAKKVPKKNFDFDSAVSHLNIQPTAEQSALISYYAGKPLYKDSYYVIRTRLTSKPRSFQQVYFIDCLDSKTNTWGWSPQKHTKAEATSLFEKMNNTLAFKGIPQKSVQLFVVPAELLIVNASSPNAFNPNSLNLTEFTEPDFFGSDLGKVFTFSEAGLFGLGGGQGIILLGSKILKESATIYAEATVALAVAVAGLTAAAFAPLRRFFIEKAFDNKTFNRA